jgi:hypothetical protein
LLARPLFASEADGIVGRGSGSATLSVAWLHLANGMVSQFIDGKRQLIPALAD